MGAIQDISKETSNELCGQRTLIGGPGPIKKRYIYIYIYDFSLN